MLEITQKTKFPKRWIVRVDKEMDNQVLILTRKHKVEKSTVIRSLIEAGLTLTK